MTPVEFLLECFGPARSAVESSNFSNPMRRFEIEFFESLTRTDASIFESGYEFDVRDSVRMFEI